MNNKKGYLDLASKAYIDKNKKNLGIWDILKEGNIK